MVKHVILWTLRPELSESEKVAIKANIKKHLEALRGVVPGLVEATVYVDGILPSSNCDLMLDTTLASAEALKAYAVHPSHVAAANTYVRPYTSQRVCLDFEL